MGHGIGLLGCRILICWKMGGMNISNPCKDRLVSVRARVIGDIVLFIFATAVI